MPLSEQEQRLLDEMERNLYRHDADFVAAVGGGATRPDYRMIVIGVLVGLAGVGVVFFGVATHLLVLGVAGFILMLVGALLAMKRSKVAAKPNSNTGKAPSKSSFMDRMNQRWDNREGRGNG